MHRPILFAGMSYSGVNPMFVIASELSRRGREGIWFAAEKHLRADVEQLSYGKYRLLEAEVENIKPAPKLDAAEMVLCYSMLDMDYPFSAPDNVHTIGAMIPALPQMPRDEITDWLDAHESTVFIAFGTITRLTREQVGALVETVRGLGSEHAVLWKLPRAQQALLPPADEPPDNLRIEDWIPSQLRCAGSSECPGLFQSRGREQFPRGHPLRKTPVDAAALVRLR